MQSIASEVSAREQSVSIEDFAQAGSSEKEKTPSPEEREAVAGIVKVSDEIEKRFAVKEKPASPKSPEKVRDDFFMALSPPQQIRPPWREAAEKKKDSVDSPKSPVSYPPPFVPQAEFEPVPVRPEPPISRPEEVVVLREKEDKKKQPLPEVIPGEETMEWCKRIAKEYKFLKVTDFTKSFKSGLAFCAFIHCYRPELIGDISQIRHNGNPKDNCTKAFQVAEEHLGVKSTLNINDVVMCPEKNKVKAYVERLRHTLEGTTPSDLTDAARMSDYRLSTHPFFGLSESEEKVMEELQKLKERSLDADAVDYSNVPDTVDGGNVKYAAVVPGVSAPEAKEPIRATPLMTRKQLQDPFGSDGSDEDGAKQINGFESPTKGSNTPLSIKLESLGGSANQAELRQRARQLLANPEAMLGGSFTPTSTDDERSKRLLQEARERIEEATTSGGTFSVTGTSDDTPSIPACARPSQRTMNSSLQVNGNSGGGSSALDRVKRYGSMRRQELTEMIQQMTTGSTIPNSEQESTFDIQSTPTRKLTNDWEKDARDPTKIERELGKITMQMAQLETENTEINEKIRDVAQGSNEEQKLIEASIRCTSDRDKLQKKVDYYNDVLTIIELTENIEKIQKELDTVTDEIKTEDEKRHIDKLMNELREITNEKMHLTLKVGNIHSEEEEHDEHLRRTLDRAQNPGNFQRGTQESASKRLISWLRS
ncbi:hypothetical protein L596_013094 [Steinernema carpocapsae]|uniref:Calponin-homology (CH) domain-containing protein n=1 Tax=Steinernema carpocapsae TaxID=34508 RepID=A0A4V6A4Z6_STECR|nr:hypothetical protein L596_013094 [Steinernema carpocapsae]